MTKPSAAVTRQLFLATVTVIFLAGCSEKPATPAPQAAAAPPAAAVSPAVAHARAPIDPPPGGTTIATVWETRAALAGKPVTVRGKVVKFNGGIRGVNWLHLQDGSGQASDGSNDITVTSEKDEAQPGDVITVTGTVAVNKDLGSGYSYPVIIEHATIARQ